MPSTSHIDKLLMGNQFCRFTDLHVGTNKYLVICADDESFPCENTL